MLSKTAVAWEPSGVRHLEVLLSLCHNPVLCTCLLPEVVTGFVEGTLDHGTQESRKDMGGVRDHESPKAEPCETKHQPRPDAYQSCTDIYNLPDIL